MIWAIHKYFISRKFAALFTTRYNELGIRMTTHVLMGIFFLAANGSIFSQEKSSGPLNQQWAQYYSQIQLPQKWGVNADLSLRRRDNCSAWSQASVRGGISYALHPTISVAGGLAYFISFQNNRSSESENRAWIEIVCKHAWPALNLQHRFRVEDRYFHSLYNGSTNSNYRVRYRLYFTFPINHSALTDHTLFLLGGDEIFINAEKATRRKGCDQNRLLTGLGFQLNEQLQFSLTYVYQHRQNSKALIFEETNILWFGIVHKLSIKKKTAA